MECIELEPINPPRPLHTLLLEHLLSNEELFENSVRKAVADGDTDINFVLPHPLNKTLLEVACSEGRQKSVGLLLKLGADVNRTNNVYKRAPIHFAAEAGHADVLQVLLNEEQCNPDLKDDNQQLTALLIAVDKDYTHCVSVLLDYCANPNIPNSAGLTPIHIAARKPNRKVVETILIMTRFPLNLDDFHDRQDDCELTTRQILQKEFLDVPPAKGREIDIHEIIHPYTDGNELDFLEYLKTIANLTREVLYDLMFIAVMRDFPDAMRELLHRGRDHCRSIIPNVSIAAVKVGHHRVLKEMLPVDAEVGKSLLLLACYPIGRRGVRSNHMMCLNLILRQPNINVRCEDDSGNTPLHYAARADFTEGVRRLLKLGCSLGHRNVFGVPPLAHMSCGALSDIFDNCIRTACAEKNIYMIEFDYRYFIPQITRSKQPDKAHEELQTSAINMSISSEMAVLAYIAENPDLRPLLKHPLLTSFLDLKWNRIRYIHWANLIVYGIFYILITCYILSTNHTIDSASSSPPKSNCEQLNALGVLTAICLTFLALYEICQLITSPGHYFTSLQNILEFVVIVLGVWMLVAPNPEIGAIVILLATWVLLILIGNYPRWSIGVEMLKIVTINFIKYLSLYVIIIVAFAFAFSILFSNTKDNENFLDPLHSVFKTIIMLTGEFDSNDIPFMSHPVLSRFIFVLFVLLIVIVMLNLLNGLAVSDTADILKKSEIVALTSRVKLISYFEGEVVGSRLIKFAGCWFSQSAVRRSMFKPPAFLGMKTLLFPKYLPKGKINVMPYDSNKIIIHGIEYKVEHPLFDDKIAKGTSRTSPDRKTWFRACFERLVTPPVRTDGARIIIGANSASSSSSSSNLTAPSLSLENPRFPPSNRVTLRGAIDWSMDPLIVRQAREALSRRESQRKALRIAKERANEFDTIKAKLETLETAIHKYGNGNVRKSLLSRRPKASERARATRQPRVRPNRPQKDCESTVRMSSARREKRDYEQEYEYERRQSGASTN